VKREAFLRFTEHAAGPASLRQFRRRLQVADLAGECLEKGD
jgi:hypothetical protein